MSAAASTDRPRAGKSRRIPTKVVLWAIAAIVLVVLALDTSYQDAGKPVAGAREKFDVDKFGTENFPKLVPEIEKNATDVTVLLPALESDQEAASQKYGRRQGQSPYNFPVRGEGVAGTPESGILPIEVKGLKKGTVSMQIGPAINGTALRDVASFIKFDQFVNQVDYADAATALNNEVKTKVLKGVDPASIEGKNVSFVGAFTLLTPSAVTVTPVKLEVAG
jgi:predicted lipoprotein